MPYAIAIILLRYAITLLSMLFRYYAYYYAFATCRYYATLIR